MSEEDLPKRIKRYQGEIELKRIALTEQDTMDGLPSFPARDKAKDPRYRWFVKNYGTECWELDTMSPVILREQVETFIKAEIDWEAWKRCQRVEQAEQDTLATVMENWEAMKEYSHESICRRKNAGISS